jgi:hypothetical protein
VSREHRALDLKAKRMEIRRQNKTMATVAAMGMETEMGMAGQT